MNARADSGFILPMALFAMALVSLALLPLLEASWARARQVRVDREQTESDILAETAFARASLLVATSRRTARSLEWMVEAPRGLSRQQATKDASLVLDGRLYTFADAPSEGARVRIRLQDEAGLVNLNGTDAAVIERIAVLSGAPGSKARALAARLLDYVDADDLTRPNGADGDIYRRSGAPGPRNRPLETPMQVFSALGWADALDRDQATAFLARTTATASRIGFNPNTADIAVLQAVLDVDGSAAMRVRATREKQLLLSSEDVLALSGSPRADLQIRAFPSRSLRVTVTVLPTASQESYVYVSRLAIAQQATDGPIDVTRLEKPRRVRVRERARRQQDDPVVVLPVFFGGVAP